MSDLKTYRPTEDCIDPRGGHVFDYGAHSASVESPFRCIVSCNDEPCKAVLIPAVPDTRLQDIADAWNTGGRYQTATRVSLRVAWPELAALLDALIQEDK